MEILEVKHKRNITFLEAGFDMGENTYASVAWKVDPISYGSK